MISYILYIISYWYVLGDASLMFTSMMFSMVEVLIFSHHCRNLKTMSLRRKSSRNLTVKMLGWPADQRSGCWDHRSVMWKMVVYPWMMRFFWKICFMVFWSAELALNLPGTQKISISRQGQVANLSATGSGRAQPHRLREGNLGAADWGSILSTGTTRLREWNLHTRGDDRPEWRCVFNGYTWYRYPYILYIYILIIYNYIYMLYTYIHIWYYVYIILIHTYVYIYIYIDYI